MKKIFALFALVVLPLIPRPLTAQDTRATISGTVLDPSGARIPNASITLTETRTGVKTPAASDTVGSYSITFLPPGEYEIRVEVAGFKSFVRRGFRLASSDHPVLDIRMEIGSVSELVTVVAETPMLETANVSTGQSISTKQIEDFPLNGRNPMMVVQLALGVIATGNPNTPISPFANGAASGWSIGGTPSQTSEIMIDGAPNATWDNRVAYAPPQEAVQEVKVKAFDGDAGFGHTGGGTINKVMRTGTNQFHGSAYDFMQPSAMAANNFFNNKAGIPVQDTKFNQWGGTAGGPVRIPKLFDGRNKLFWFFAIERITGSQPNTKFLTVPTDAERKGDFSALLGLGSSYQIYNPYSGVLSGSTVRRSPFYCDTSGNPITPNLTPGTGFGTQATGTACNKIPQQLLNPVSLAYLQFFPAPNITGRADGYSNYGNSNTTDDDFSNQLGRLDWAMSSRSRLSFNIRHTDYLQSKNDYFNNNAHGLASMLTRGNWGSSVDEVYTLNNTTVLNLRANFTRLRETHPSPSEGFDPGTLGFPSYLAANSKLVQLPRISFGNCGNDSTQATSFDCLGQTGADLLPSNSYSLFGTVVKQWRSHVFKFGVDARRYLLDAQTYGNSIGSFTFGGFGTANGWTQSASNATPAPFGQDFAAFLLGLPTSGQYDLNARGTYTANYYALFVQDDWRIKSNLTINLGLRVDQDMPYSEKLDRTVNGFDFTTKNPIADAAIAAYNSKTASKMPYAINFAVPGGLTFASPQDREIYQITSRIMSPRVGVAWSPGIFHEKIVIRSGFGIFVQPIAMSNLNPTGGYSSTPILTQEGFSQTTQFPVPSTLLLPTANLSDPFPNGFIQPPGSAAGLTTFLGQNVDFFNSNMKNPYSIRWTFGIQQQITPTLVMEVAYIGNHALRMPMSVTQLNGIPRQYLSTLPYRDATLITTLTASVPNPLAGLIPSLGNSGLNGTNTSVRQLLTPFPQFPVADSTSFSSGVTMRNSNAGSSYFNSLNVRVEKRLSRGLQVVATYGWSKLIERDSWLNNTDGIPEKRISPFDRPHRFVGAVNYDLPIGKGKLIDLKSRWLDRIVGGWRINGIYTYQVGAPILWMNGSTNNPGDYPLCSVPTVNGLCPSGSEATSLRSSDFNLNSRGVDLKAFDTTRFVTATAGQFQFHLRTMPSTFGDLRSDGQNNFDASILKKFQTTESTYVQFRFEAFNVLNHVAFGVPNVQATSSSFGTITTQANRPRQIQIGLRFVF
jgi:hypothetical protein